MSRLPRPTPGARQEGWPPLTGTFLCLLPPLALTPLAAPVPNSLEIVPPLLLAAVLLAAALYLFGWWRHKRKLLDHQEQLRRRNDLLLALTQAQAAFIAGGEPRHVFETMLQTLLRVSDSEYGLIGEVLADEAGRPLLQARALISLARDEATRRFYEEHAPAGLRFTNLQTLLGAVLTRGEPVLANDPANDPRAGGLPPGHPPLRAFLGLPLHAGAQLVGMVGIANRPGGYDAALIDFLQPFRAICTTLVVALASRRQHEQAEQALETSEQRLRMALHAGHMGIWDWEPDSGRLVWSEEHERLFGLAPGSFPQTYAAFAERVHPDDLPRLQERASRSRAARAECLQEYRITRTDGAVRWMAARGHWLLDASGEPRRMLGVLQDVTDRKCAEIERDQMAMIARLTANGVVLTDAAGCIQWVNDGFTRLCGCTLEEARGRRPGDLIQGPDTDPATVAHMRTQLARGEGFHVEVLNYHRSGRPYWIDLDVQPVRDDSGRLTGFIGLELDITARKQAEQAWRESEARYRLIVDNMQDVISLHDPVGRMLYLTPSAVRLTGFSIEQTMATPLDELVHPEDLPCVQAALAATSRGETTRVEWRQPRRDGSWLWMETLATAPGEAGGLIIASSRDISDRKRRETLEEQLRQAQKMEAVGQLAGGIAHDFNNLLTVINGCGRLALDAADFAAAREPVEQILEAAARAAELTRQLLAFSRKQVLAPRVLDLAALARRLERMLGRVLRDDIRLELHAPADLWRVLADPGQVEQVILNLAVNARDAMPAGGRLTLELAHVTLDEAAAARIPDGAPGEYVCLSVADTGCGMNAETRTRLFEPFFTTKGPDRGTGLGLATVYGIVRQSGGFVTVDSTPGHGSRFHVHFPRSRQALPVEPPPPTAAAPPRGETILLVEDEAVVRRLARLMLEREGYRVLEAPSGAEALVLAETRRGPIHLLMTDVVMAGMSGPELAGRLADLGVHVPVLYISGYPADMIGDHGILAPGTTFLQKPFRAEALHEQVRRVLDRPPDAAKAPDGVAKLPPVP